MVGGRRVSYKMTTITSLDLNKLNICIDILSKKCNKLAAEAAYSFETNARHYFEARL